MSLTFIINNNNYSNSIHKPKLSRLKIPSPSEKKPFSTVIRELDYNSYRAYKMSSDLSLSNNNSFSSLPKSRNIANIILKSSYKHNAMKIPFGLKSKRFEWQTDHTSNQVYEINGTMKNYTLNTSYRRHSPLTTNTNSIRNKILGLNHAHHYAVAADLNTFRTITPERDITPNGTIQPTKRKVLSTSTTGSISNLLKKTPMNKSIPVRNAIGKESGVFTKEYYNSKYYKRQKTPVNLEKVRMNRSFAGSRKMLDINGDNFLYHSENRKASPLNIAREVKIKANESDIFHVKKHGHEIYNAKGKRQYSFIYDENQNDFFNACK